MLSSRKPKRSAHCPCIDFLLTPCAHPLRCAVGGGAPLDTTISKDRAEEMSQWRGQHPQAQRWPLGGALHRRLHSQYLHPRHGGDEALRRRHHRQRHQPDHVAHKNSRRGAGDAFRSSPVISAFGSRFGSSEKRQNIASLFENINAKKFLISYEIRNFLVETAGLEPVTSCV